MNMETEKRIYILAEMTLLALTKPEKDEPATTTASFAAIWRWAFNSLNTEATNLRKFLEAFTASRWNGLSAQCGENLLKFAGWLEQNVPAEIRRQACLRALGRNRRWGRNIVVSATKPTTNRGPNGIATMTPGKEISRHVGPDNRPTLVWASRLARGSQGMVWGYWFPHMNLGSVKTAEENLDENNGACDTLVAPLWDVRGDEDAEEIFARLQKTLEGAGISVPEI